MFLTDGYSIKIPRGDSADIKFTFLCDDGETPYMLGTGEIARLDVFPVRGAESVIAMNAGRESQAADGSVTFVLTGEDTAVSAGVYRYTIRLTGVSSCDTVLGFPEDALFAVGTDCEGCGDSTAAGSIKVTVGQGGGTLPPYTGEYTVAPSFDSDTVLETAQRTTLGDITVRRVPVTRSENSAGGITLTIGGQE